jgi:diguanylate cyclase (GGDEF)-like protein
MAYIDTLTGIPSRRAMEEHFDRLSPPFTIAMTDIDHFKKFNDTYGHDVGDDVLRKVAMTLKSVGGGGKAFRYGGEEFAVFLPETNRDEAMIIAERIRHQIEVHKTPWQKHRIRVTASIGVAYFNPENEEANQDEIIARADRAMYLAKENGKNRIQLAKTDTETH